MAGGGWRRGGLALVVVMVVVVVTVATLAEEVIALEWPPRWVSEHHQPKLRRDHQHLATAAAATAAAAARAAVGTARLTAAAATSSSGAVDGAIGHTEGSGTCRREQPAPITKRELTILRKRLEHAHRLERRLVGLVDHQDVTAPRRAYQRRVLPSDVATLEHRPQRERRDGRVAVQLDVLALRPQQVEQLVSELVLTDALQQRQQQQQQRWRLLGRGDEGYGCERCGCGC